MSWSFPSQDSGYGSYPYPTYTGRYGNTFRVAPFNGRRGINRTRTSKRSKWTKPKSFRAKMISYEPTKHYANSSNLAMLADNIYAVMPTSGITQGTGVTNRIGDSVELISLKIRGNYSSDSTAGAYQLRCIVGYTTYEFNAPSVFGAANQVTQIEVFQTNTPANTWVCNGVINKKAFTVLHDQTWDVNSSISAVRDLIGIDFTVPLKNKHFEYVSTASAFGKKVNLVILLMADVVGGTANTTSVGGGVFAYDLCYK